MQLDLLEQNAEQVWQLDADCRLRLLTQFLPDDLALSLFDILRGDLQWEQSTITIAGRSLKIPRLNAWYGDDSALYTYSGKRFTPLAWTAELEHLRDLVMQASGHRFNSVLANLYRDHRDSVAWHADDEPQLGRNPVIASLSLGEARRFQCKSKREKGKKPFSLELAHNSLLIMEGAMQHHWQHQVPKSRAPLGERINLTFRLIVDG